MSPDPSSAPPVNRAPHGREKSRRRSQAARSNSTSCRPGLDLPPVSIERMRGIEREAVDANVGPIATMFEARLQAIVARLAKRSDRPEQEGVVIALMRREVIGDRGRGYTPLLFAGGAQRLDAQLMLGACPPALQAIPSTRRERLSGGEVARMHGALFKPVRLARLPRASNHADGGLRSRERASHASRGQRISAIRPASQRPAKVEPRPSFPFFEARSRAVHTPEQGMVASCLILLHALKTL